MPARWRFIRCRSGTARWRTDLGSSAYPHCKQRLRCCWHAPAFGHRHPNETSATATGLQVAPSALAGFDLRSEPRRGEHLTESARLRRCPAPWRDSTYGASLEEASD